MVRKTLQRETQFLSEYLVASFPDGNFKTNVEIGALEPEVVDRYGLEAAARVLRSWRRRIDAVAWYPDKYYLIEAKIRDPFEGLGRLHIYQLLALDTPDLPHYTGQPFVKRLVVPVAQQWIIKAALRDNMEVITFWRDWISDYVKEIQNYHTAAYRTARHEKLRMREILGLE